MSSRLAVLAVFALAVSCSSYELAAIGPSRSLDARAPGATPAEVWSDAVLTSEPAGLPAPSADADGSSDWSHHATLFIGIRHYSDGNLDQSYPGGGNLDMEKSGFKGLEIESCDESSGHGYEVGISVAYQTDDTDTTPNDYELTTEEFYGGYRYTFRTADPENICHPFLGAGLSVIRAHIDTPPFPPFNDDASALAGYAHLGATWEVGARLRLGFDFRELFGTNDLDIGTPTGESSADVDNEQIAFTIGYLL
jgi:hypothetical protein